MSSPAGLLYLCVDVLHQLLRWRLVITGAPGQSWALMRQCGEQETLNVVHAIASPLASILEDLYSFTCCPDSSVVERHLGKMEVPGSIPGRGSDKPVSSEAGFFVYLFSLPEARSAGAQ